MTRAERARVRRIVRREIALLFDPSVPNLGNDARDNILAALREGKGTR